MVGRVRVTDQSVTATDLSLRMTKPLRLLLLPAAVAFAALGGAAHALAGGSSETYSYAGMRASSNAYGISARIAQLDASDLLTGHVTGWVGVGGRGQGPHGSNEWLRVGSVAFPGVTGSDIYYEVALPGSYPAYHEVSTGVAVGTYTKVTVLAMHDRPNWWRVWVNHKPVSAPIRLPGSRDGLLPTVRSECWDAGTGGICNDFPSSFRDVSIARAPGGNWEQLRDG
jgi:hypothetical protein